MTNANTEMRQLRPGEAVVLQELTEDGLVPEEVTVSLSSESETPDLVALLLGQEGRVRSRDDLVFYNNTVSGDSAVTHDGRRRGRETVTVRPGSLDADSPR